MPEFDLSVDICGVTWKNPIATASGTFNFRESSRYYRVSDLGCITTKGVSREPWGGNETPKIAETRSGMLNSIGLENRGVEMYIDHDLKPLKEAGATVMANVAGHTIVEYCSVAERLAKTAVDLLEINISCPNVKEGGIAFGTDKTAAAELVTRVKKVSGAKPVIVKLSPNVTDITEIALAVERAGADGLSLINTLKGMRIDLNTGKPVLANGSGGLSGPAIHPVAVWMVYETARVCRIPIIGMGGVMTGADALELMLAGAKAVAVGTAALIDPVAPTRILGELAGLLRK
ncbi:MAG: dihydroorotate dehydrogenase [Clostridiales Family XIII bacterium]|jgi:dihydroorotate dehydrogenase (NAD+) catalytic subunit|nr:dihydroorotate dehydrogenase [Clostridiales Family XIII bacterium]